MWDKKVDFSCTATGWFAYPFLDDQIANEVAKGIHTGYDNFKDVHADTIECAASNTGVLTPPVMGAACLSAAIEGYFYGMRRIGWLRRILFIGIAVLLFLPETSLNFVGFGLALAVFFEKIIELKIKKRRLAILIL